MLKKRILVLEDEPALAENLQIMLDDLGFDVVGVVQTLEAARAFALSSQVDAAVLDINIHGQDSVAIAQALRMRGIPYLLMTGHAPQRAEKFGAAPILFKPFVQDELRLALQRLF